MTVRRHKGLVTLSFFLHGGGICRVRGLRHRPTLAVVVMSGSAEISV